MNRLATVTSEAMLTAFIDSLSSGAKETLAEQLIDESLAANCTGFQAAQTTPFLESIGSEAEFESNKFAQEARLLLHLRFLLLWQLLLVKPSEEIKKRVEVLLSVICSISSLSTKDRVRVQLMMYYAWQRYNERGKAREALTIALETAGMTLKLKAETANQENARDHFILKMALPPDAFDCSEESDLFTIVKDHGLRRSEKDASLEPLPPLSSLHLALLLAAADHACKTEQDVQLRVHKCDAYIEQRYVSLDHLSTAGGYCLDQLDNSLSFSILLRRRCWPVQATALALLVQTEVEATRRVEWACRQMESLVKAQMGEETPATSLQQFIHRGQLCLEAGIAPFWRMKDNYERMRIDIDSISKAEEDLAKEDVIL